MSPIITNLLIKALGQTVYMVSISMLIASLIGIPLGILLVVTEKNNILSCPIVNRPLSFIINIIRSIPFIILMVAIIPFARILAGTSIGTTAAIIPLTLAEIPFGLIEAAQSMGATPLQIIYKVLLPESLPSILDSMTVVMVSLVGASAMAGTIGGGGLGDLAIRYGYQRFQADIMIITIIVLVLMVQSIQFLGSFLSRKADKR